MLIRNTVFPFLTLAISLSVQGVPIGSKPRGSSHIVIARNAAGFLERDAPFDDKTLFLRSGERSRLEARQQQKGPKSGQQNSSSHKKNIVYSWGKNTDRNRRKKAKQRAKAKLRKAAANANSVHPAVTANTVATPPHVGALKEPVQAPLTEAEKLELEKAAEKKKDEGEAKKEEPKPVISEHKETPVEKKEELNHLQTTEGQAPAPPTGADLANAATAAVGSFAGLVPMITQGTATGGSLAIANNVMGGGASGSPNSGSSSNAGSSSTGDGVPPSSTGSSSSSNSSGDTGSSSSDSSTSSNKGEEGKGDEDGGKKEDDGTGDGKGDETGDGSDNGKGDESSNSEDDKNLNTDTKKKSPDSDSGHGSTEENGASTKIPKGNDEETRH